MTNQNIAQKVMMNDFTKEELDELRSSRCYHLDDNYPYEDALFMKLESMIDNYCEHEPCGEQEIFVDICNKCNGVMVRNE